MSGGLSARNDFGARFLSDLVDCRVDTFVIGIAGNDVEGVPGEAHPGGAAFPVAEVPGDEEGSFAFSHGLIEVVSTNDFGGSLDIGLGATISGKEIGGGASEVEEDSLGDALDFLLGFFGKGEFKVIDSALFAFTRESPHKAAVAFTDSFDLFGLFAFDSSKDEIEKELPGFVNELLCRGGFH